MTNQENTWRPGRPGSGVKIVTHTLYDKALYAPEGQNDLRFFRVPIMAGKSLFRPDSSKLIADTNMDLAGSLPIGQAFLATSISFKFQSGLWREERDIPYARRHLIDEDNEVFWHAGGASFQFFILCQLQAQGLVYRAQAPDLPCKSRELGQIEKAALELMTVADNMLRNATQWRNRESVWDFPPPGLMIHTNVFFDVRLGWPKPVALPSGWSGIVTAELIGELMTVAQ